MKWGVADQTGLWSSLWGIFWTANWCRRNQVCRQRNCNVSVIIFSVRAQWMSGCSQAAGRKCHQLGSLQAAERCHILGEEGWRFKAKTMRVWGLVEAVSWFRHSLC